MPSTTRGSILISTANDIGEALVEKLGGVGYSPNEWKEKYNLCGIAPVDSAPALSVLSDSAGTGDERGSILIATADAIGAILNKKYNVLRGFKPKEWASACRKMKALEEGSVASASIASFSNGADTVPLTSCVCSINANLDGKTAVNAVHARKNLLDTAIAETKTNNSVSITCDGNGKYTATGTATGGSANITFTLKTPCTIKSGMFLHLMNSGASGSVSITLQKQDNTSIYAPALSPANRIADLSSYVGEIIYSIRFYVANGNSFEMSLTPMLCFSNATTTFEPYQTPETKTADLGRAVYGGSADIINGTGTIGYALFTKNTADMNNSESYPGWKDQGVRAICGGGLNQEYEDGVTSAGNGYGINTLGNTNDILYLPKSMHNNMTQTDWVALAIDITFVIPLATPEDFTFEPVKIDSFPGVNNIWNDCGNTEVEYYQAPTPYARKTATGGIANFSDQRTDLPLTKAIANIAPSIAGKSAVNLIRAGKNIFDKTKATTGKYINVSGQEATNEAKAHSELLPINPSTSYYMSGHADASYYSILALDKDMNVLSTWYGGASKTESFVATTPSNARWCYLNFNADQIDTMIFAESATAISYEPYNGETYTAELGETVYGGSVDFVSGEVKQSSILIDLSTIAASSWNMGASDRFRARLTQYQTASGWSGNWQNTVSNVFVCEDPSTPFNNRSNYSFSNIPQNYYNFDIKAPSGEFENATAFAAWLANTDGNGKHAIIVIDRAEVISSSIPGRVISPIDGVNNYWNDAGGDTEIQYFENET